MGRDKALLEVDGAAMALRVADALREAGRRRGRRHRWRRGGAGPARARVVADDDPGEGPFPATLTALRHAPTEVVAVLSCDLLAPERGRGHGAGAGADGRAEALAAVPVVDGHHQWTHAAWRRGGARAARGAPTAPGVRSLRRAATDLAVVRGRRPRWPVGRRCRHAGRPARPSPPSDRPARVASAAMDVPEIDVAELAARRADGRAADRRPRGRRVRRGPRPGRRATSRWARWPSGSTRCPPTGTVYVICAGGGRSAKAVEHYRSPGHRRRERRRRHARRGSTPGCPPTDGPGARPGARERRQPARHPRAGSTTTPASREVVDELAAADVYGLDTEFHRERTYHARLALLQLSWPGGIAVVDPPPVDVAPLAAVLDGPGLCVMHAASQDLEILARVCGTVPSRLFDTQVAAGFVGYSSVGLAGLVQGELGVKLPKADRLTDWLARPLPGGRRRPTPPPTSPTSTSCTTGSSAKLEARGRLQWALDECEVHRTRAASGQRARPGVVADQGGPVAAGPGGRGGPGRWPRGASGGPPRSTGRCASCSPTSPSWRWPSARRPPRTTCAACAGLDEGKRKGGAAKRAAGGRWPRAWSCRSRRCRCRPSEGVDRRRRAAASLVERLGRAAGPRPRHRRRHPRHPRRHRGAAHGRRRPAGHRLAPRRGRRADPGAGRRGGVAGRRPRRAGCVLETRSGVPLVE